MGYASSGLELWAYPLQLISGYELGFRPAGDTTETAGSLLLRRVTYDPEAITRTYIGPDFIVRERLLFRSTSRPSYSPTPWSVVTA